MAKPVYTVLVCVLFVGLTFAQTSTLRVLPWNDHLAAVSLTFDDARPAQLDVVVPELNKHHLHATFFVIVSKLTRLDDWRKAQAQGHEIGNHSVTHEHPEVLTRASEEIEVEDAKKFLDSNFNSNVVIFAYPYAELSPGLVFWVKKYDLRHGAGTEITILPTSLRTSNPTGITCPVSPPTPSTMLRFTSPGSTERSRCTPGLFFKFTVSATPRLDLNPSLPIPSLLSSITSRLKSPAGSGSLPSGL
jgi:peptidoglycan/xylan/chitin deacetylase (PgdA/CDA1 family)